MTTKPTVTIRSITEDDLEDMYQISTLAHQAGYASLIPESGRAAFDERYTVNDTNKQRYIAMMREHMADEKWLFWIAEVEGRIAGYTLGYKESDTKLLKKGLFVLPDFQGLGVGSLLFKASLEPIQKGVIELVVIESNQRARHVYEKNGFVPIGVHEKTFFDAPQITMQLIK